MGAPSPVVLHHFTHLRNLEGIVANGLRSDAACRAEGLTQVEIGAPGIRERRLRLPVGAGPRGFVGDYVPFYYAPRSPMMFTLGKQNYDFQQGFDDVVYLTSTLEDIDAAGIGWVASDRNAALSIASFTDEFSSIGDHVRWDVMRLRYWNDVPGGADLRAAELLAHDHVPWELVRRVTARTRQAGDRVMVMLDGLAHQPQVDVRPEWYF